MSEHRKLFQSYNFMKILITTDLFTTTTNGVVTSVNNLCDELTKRGHEVRILTLSQSAHSRKEGSVSYIRSMPFPVYPNIRMPLTLSHKLVRELIDWKPDLIHSQCEFFTYSYAKKISKMTGAPIIQTYHTMYEQYVTYVIPFKRLGATIIRKWIRRRLKKAACVIAPTKKVQQSLESYRLVPPIEVIPSGINLEQHKTRIPKAERLSMRQKLEIPNDAFVLINLGRLGGEKNLGELIRYFSVAHSSNPNLRLMIVGDGPARNDLEKLSESLGLSKKVIFTGMVDPKQVHYYYQLGDLFVSASTSETQGLTYVEAAANGLPLLCRRDPCLEDILAEGQSGYAYSTEEEFLNYLESIVKNPAWHVFASDQSRKLAMRFDKGYFGETAEALYQRVLEQQKR